MKTSIQYIKVTVIITLLFICGIGLSQKSINYQSVGTHLEEISIFFAEKCQSIEKTSPNVTFDDLQIKEEQTTDIIGNTYNLGKAKPRNNETTPQANFTSVKVIDEYFKRI